MQIKYQAITNYLLVIHNPCSDSLTNQTIERVSKLSRQSAIYSIIYPFIHSYNQTISNLLVCYLFLIQSRTHTVNYDSLIFFVFVVPEYDVTTPRQTESNGRVMSHFRRRRSVAPPDVLHYKLHAFGSKLKLRLKRNSMLMAPNLVIETHAREGVVTIRPPPKNKFYLGKLPSDPDSMVALRSDRGLVRDAYL